MYNFLEGSHQALCMVIEGDRKVVLVTLLIATKNVWSPYKWWLKMGFNCHLKSLDFWIVIKKFQSPMSIFGKGACNMFLESFHWIICVITKSNWKFSHQLLVTKVNEQFFFQLCSLITKNGNQIFGTLPEKIWAMTKIFWALTKKISRWMNDHYWSNN